MESFRGLRRRLDQKLEIESRGKNAEQTELETVVHNTQAKRARLLVKNIPMNRPGFSEQNTGFIKGMMIISKWYEIGEHKAGSEAQPKKAKLQARLRSTENASDDTAQAYSKPPIDIDLRIWDIDSDTSIVDSAVYEFTMADLLIQPVAAINGPIPVKSREWADVDKILGKIETQNAKENRVANVLASIASTRSVTKDRI